MTSPSSTVGSAVASATAQIADAGSQTPRLDAELLLSMVTNLDRAMLIANPQRELAAREADRFAELLRRRCLREPVAYILGYKHFRSLQLAVDDRVLIPRPETEAVVEAALTLPIGARVVDVGTGSGAIALSLKMERPDLEIIATDLSSSALDVARTNARRLGLEVDFKQANLLDWINDEIDAIVSNPPYVGENERESLAPEIRQYEPASALFAGKDGLDVFRTLIPQAGASQAWFVAFEIGATQAHTVAELLGSEGFSDIQIVQDLAGLDRVVIARRRKM